MGILSKYRTAKKKYVAGKKIYDEYSAKRHTRKVSALKERADRLKAQNARIKALERQRRRITKYSTPKKGKKGRSRHGSIFDIEL